MKKVVITGLILFAPVLALAQCFARISLDRHSVYVQQPFKVTITVLTATWYTQPLDFDNIQIPNAFILPFDQTMPGMFDVNGKQYAGLQFYYIVFPYKEGTFTLPSINIVATTPPEGSSESRKVAIKTPAQKFTVKPIPANITGKWFVAKNVTISEHWDKPLQNLKVGDILERTISIHASGTLPQFIPQLERDSLDFANSYLQDADLADERNDYDANGSLRQSIIYLLEKEGDFKIPAIKTQWWNPVNGKMYSRSALAANIHVKANPNLGMLSSIKDSLNATQLSKATPVTVKKTRTLFGIAWYWAILILLGIALILYRLVFLGIRLWRIYQIRHVQYLGSESYAFRRLMKSPEDSKTFLQRMHRWWDHFIYPEKSTSLLWQLHKENKENMENELDAYYQKIYANGEVLIIDKNFKREIKDFRSELIIQEKKGNSDTVPEWQTPFKSS